MESVFSPPRHFHLRRLYDSGHNQRDVNQSLAGFYIGGVAFGWWKEWLVWIISAPTLGNTQIFPQLVITALTHQPDKWNFLDISTTAAEMSNHTTSMALSRVHTSANCSSVLRGQHLTEMSKERAKKFLTPPLYPDPHWKLLRSNLGWQPSFIQV